MIDERLKTLRDATREALQQVIAIHEVTEWELIYLLNGLGTFMAKKMLEDIEKVRGEEAEK